MKRRSSIAWGFLALILVGAALLMMPFARNAAQFGDFRTALFTSVSAVCVTGLTVVDIAAEYSRVGQVILMVLVELGCLGLMTFGTFLMIAIGRRLSLAREFSLMNAYGAEGIQGLKELICSVVGSMLIIEIAGAAVLQWRMGDWYSAVFYSIMGFCNAGFSLRPDSLAAFVEDPYIVLTLAVETILGGLGFLVIYNIVTFHFRRRRSGGKGRLSLHSKVVLRFTIYLLMIGMLLFLLLEWNGALAGMSWLKKCYVAFYQAVTPRTCGFTLVATDTLHPLTRLVYEVLMFIGGAPGSAAAGIKVTTFAVLLYTLRAMCRGERETVMSKRVVAYDTVRESIIIFMALVVLVVLVTAALIFTDGDNQFIRGEYLFFEAVSAITTTGLSCGDTTRMLSPHGQYILELAMFIGRLGALTVVMMIGDREIVRHVRYPSDELVVG